MFLRRDEHQVASGRRLRQIIDAAGISYVEAADMMGISKSNLGNWMRGDAPIGSYALYQFCVQTGATADWVLLGDPAGLPQRLARQLLS
jgi:transcriptional regulator with XRE-family HTH domain